MNTPYVERPASDRSWIQSFVMCGCLFISFLSVLLCTVIYVELRQATEGIQAARHSAEQSRLELSSYIQLSQRSAPMASPVASMSTSLPIPTASAPLPPPIVRQRGLPEPSAESAKPAADGVKKGDIPDNGKFVLVSDEVKGTQLEDKKFKLIGDK